MKFRVTLTLLKLLAYLFKHRDPRPYGLMIQRELGLTSATTYGLLDRLEKAGHLTSELEDIDEVAMGRRKRRLVQLTPSGLEFAVEAFQAVPQFSILPDAQNDLEGPSPRPPAPDVQSP
ncbi:PadR family transcriptional regulator [Deinococcus multiflagellatus]|uniref:PadR family transcriptional regulator n=1 Tax=Deinococcus multiflagellatus TaxID=1656887 RepID=A0ABW1ZP04_9DEIO|nr:hypothetical protein [Deinococcus multiflagellatus]MBZ9715596.1 hypothetical protein [Deinococcus multiflagellatus]